MRIIRAYFRESIQKEHYINRYLGTGEPLSIIPVPSDQEVADCIAKWKAREYEETRCYPIREFFQRWFEWYEADIRKKRAKAAAAGRWSKNNRKNPPPTP